MVVDTLEDEDALLPEPTRQRTEAEETDADAISRIEAATGATSGEGKDVVPTPTAIRAPKRPKLPQLPANLDAPEMVFPVKLKLVSIGKAIANVTATLNFDVPMPQDFRDVLGEHAYTVAFLGGFLGEGIQIKKAPISVDAENRTIQTLTVQVPRFLNEHTDQLLLSIAPLIGGKKFIEDLFALDWPWRLNIPVDIEGEIGFYAMQQSLALTSSTGDDAGTTRTRE